MKGCYYYIPGYDKLVYCHDVIEDCLILGGLSYYLSDSETNIFRQSISLKKWSMLKHIEIDTNKMDSYKFLAYNHKYINAWGVVERKRERDYIHLLKSATPMESIERKGLYHYF